MDDCGCVHTMGAIPSHKRACHDIKSLFHLLTLSHALKHSSFLSLSLSLPLSLPPAHALFLSLFSLSLPCLYVPPSSLARCISLYGTENVCCSLSLFLDLDEMRIECRMWKRSGTNGWNGPKANHPGRNHFGLAAGAASVVASACSCRSPWVFVLGLGPGPRLPGSGLLGCRPG